MYKTNKIENLRISNFFLIFLYVAQKLNLNFFGKRKKKPNLVTLVYTMPNTMTVTRALVSIVVLIIQHLEPCKLNWTVLDEYLHPEGLILKSSTDQGDFIVGITATHYFVVGDLRWATVSTKYDVMTLQDLESIRLKVEALKHRYNTISV
jgi:hypothetical protein